MAAGLGVVLAVLASACSDGSGGTDQTVSMRSQTVHLAAGHGVRVEVGDVNPSVGDEWTVTRKPDPGVASVAEDYHSSCRSGETGCGGSLAYIVRAKGNGTTTVEFQYCFRSSPGPDCQAKPSQSSNAPVRLVVDVK